MAVCKKKKVVAFYSIMSSGHFNVCKSLAKALLDRHSDKVEVVFIVDGEWETKLAEFDPRFKFGVIHYDNDQQKERIQDLVTNIEPFLSASTVEKQQMAWNNFLDWDVLPEIDRKSEEKILEVADFLICDQVCHLPAMQVLPYAFLVSCNPCAFGFEGVPSMGDDSRSDEPHKIQKFKEEFSSFRAKMNQDLIDFMKRRGREFTRSIRIDQPLNEETFSIYAYPRESDYDFSDEVRKRYNLFQIDSPLLPEMVPEPFQLPESFGETPGKVVYVSLGSLFSAYVDKLQRLVDNLNEIPNLKFVVSKGALGDQLNLPDNGRFYGENWLPQLSVLQSVDAAIVHGGNNTYCEAFYFGVPQIVLPAIVDQVNNAARVEELKFGYRLDLLNYTKDELEDRLNKVLNDQDMRDRLKKASQRIQKENKIHAAADYVAQFLETKLK